MENQEKEETEEMSPAYRVLTSRLLEGQHLVLTIYRIQPSMTVILDPAQSARTLDSPQVVANRLHYKPQL